MAIPPLLQGQQFSQHTASASHTIGQQQWSSVTAPSRTDLHAITSITLQRDEVNNCYRCKVYVVQGCNSQQNDEVFVLYDGPFPITNEGIMEHLANFARELLVDEK